MRPGGCGDEVAGLDRRRPARGRGAGPRGMASGPLPRRRLLHERHQRRPCLRAPGHERRGAGLRHQLQPGDSRLRERAAAGPRRARGAIARLPSAHDRGVARRVGSGEPHVSGGRGELGAARPSGGRLARDHEHAGRSRRALVARGPAPGRAAESRLDRHDPGRRGSHPVHAIGAGFRQPPCGRTRAAGSDAVESLRHRRLAGHTARTRSARRS